MRFQSGEHVLHPSSGERRGNGNSTTSIGHRGGCWAWKHRNLMSFPKLDVADPCTATDYKDPDLVGYEE